MAKQIVPRFLLKGVDMKALLSSYIQGEVESPKLPPRPEKRAVIEKKDRTQDLIAHNTSYDPIYETKYRGEVSRIYTTGSDFFSSVSQLSLDENNTTSIEVENVPCIYCRLPVLPKEAVPSVITNYYINNGEHYYEGYDIACGTPCAKAHLKYLYASDPNNHIYMRSFTHLNNLYYRKTGNMNIPSLPDWRLLDHNGGSMTPDMFFGTKETYHQLPNVISLPCKLQFSSKLVS